MHGFELVATLLAKTHRVLIVRIFFPVAPGTPATLTISEVGDVALGWNVF